MTDTTALIRRAFEAQSRGDLDPTRAVVHAEAVLHVPDFVPLTGLSGFDGLVTLVAEMMGRADGGFATDLVEAIGAGDIVTTVNQVTATRGGNTLTYNTVWVFRFQGDQVSEAWLHPSLPSTDIKDFYGW